MVNNASSSTLTNEALMQIAEEQSDYERQVESPCQTCHAFALAFFKIRSSSNLFTLDRLAPGSLELETRFKFPILRRRCRRLFSEMRDLQKSIFDASRPIWSILLEQLHELHPDRREMKSNHSIFHKIYLPNVRNVSKKTASFPIRQEIPISIDCTRKHVRLEDVEEEGLNDDGPRSATPTDANQERPTPVVEPDLLHTTHRRQRLRVGSAFTTPTLAATPSGAHPVRGPAGRFSLIAQGHRESVVSAFGRNTLIARDVLFGHLTRSSFLRSGRTVAESAVKVSR
ncbi:hypothetical protein T05_12556 [Trichinella murrelli]|uniref:Uncharacterized protein n=1 Tax=Trichinella murrelli TaxID=144512 RepID=A0A0V0U3C3_9BILA|nr:hypothetical protein T05_7110 [Trichinella murrelli]KRX45767.1 hypothetical protein T05_12556 [Trichinella murrelli]